MDSNKFAVLGTPISHSLSPDIHKIFAEGCGIDIEYKKIETDKMQLKDMVKTLLNENYIGFNCTMPLKSEIVRLLDKKSEQVEFLGACNTVKVMDNRLCGYMTDGDGMVRGIRYNSFEIENKAVMLLGTGDTSRAVLLALIKGGAKKIIILNRSKENLDAAENLFSALKKDCELDFQALNIANIIKSIEEYDIDILINTTRLGMNGSEEHLDLSFISRLKKSAVVVDAVYNPLYTKLLTSAKNSGLHIVDGFWMLVYQGVLAFEIWTGLTVPDEYITKAHNIIKR